MDSDNSTLTDKGFKFIPYNTGNSTLSLPEYGRVIQQMVDHCVTIEDKEERTVCAYAIVEVMKNLTPNNVADKTDTKKYWDHLNIMAHFELDIDFPYYVITEENLNPKPEKIPYSNSPLKFRHYGRIIEGMIAKIADMEGGEEKDELIFRVANQMKKQLMATNKEGVSDARIIHDLNFYSQGKLAVDPEKYRLCEFTEMNNEAKQSKKKKKK